jgi:threonylcarbamoyladenosine tRNA methylthiotransferase CDKAL1
MQVFIKSFGCSTNLADGAVLAGCLVQAGHKLARSISSADIVIYNTCAVKGPTEDRMIAILKRVPQSKKLIVTGCLPLINLKRLYKEVQFHAVTGPAAGQKIVDLADAVLKGDKVVATKGSINNKPGLALPRQQKSKVISVIPINYGCLGSCTYCCVLFARGHLRSHDTQEIVERIKEDLRTGFREFWITSQDTACYGRDTGSNLAELLHAICNVEGNFKIRVGMMTPSAVLDILADVIQAFKDEKIFKFVHLPVQSGDDKVLEKMRRPYSADDFRSLVKAFRASFPDMTFSTDIICGFPGETPEAFERTLRLIEEVKPDIVNVSKFFPRPMTTAAKMRHEFIPMPEMKRRAKKVSTLSKKVTLNNNLQWIGRCGEILIDETGKVSGSWVGRNSSYKPVVVKSSKNLLGRSIKTKVVDAFPTYLRGKLVR